MKIYLEAELALDAKVEGVEAEAAARHDDGGKRRSADGVAPARRLRRGGEDTLSTS